jgi:hypothetical protein
VGDRRPYADQVRLGELLVTDILEVRLCSRGFVWVLVLIVVGVFQTTGAVGQVGPGSSANTHPAKTPKGKGTLPAAAEPKLPPCPPADLPTLQPSPEKTGHHKVTLSWNASAPSVNSESNAVGYCLYRMKKQDAAKQNSAKQNDNCSDCEQINSTAVAGTGCVDDLVEDGATYSYVVIAVSAKGKPSSPSNEASAQIPPTKESASSVPMGSYPRCRGTTRSE